MVEINHRQVHSNGITLHIAEAGQGPPVLLVHGFPELWYSWRHQLPALARAGYHAVAPDLRGYGDSDAPEAVESYSMLNMAADICGLLDAIAAEKAVFVGHNWGANIVWDFARLYPRRVAAIAALSVPFRPRTPQPPTEINRSFLRGHFNFVLYFGRPGVAEAELQADVRQSLRRFFYSLSADAPPEVVSYLYTSKPADTGVLDGMPDPPVLPAWLTDADLDYYARAFERTGFRGALNRYRNLDRDWQELASVANVTIRQPVLYIGGDHDPVVRFGSLEPMKAALPNLRQIKLLPGCGHWTQQERQAEVTSSLLAFLQGLNRHEATT